MKNIKVPYAITRDYQEFGTYLCELRLKAGLTQRDVSDLIGYSSGQYISNFERGIALPPLAKLKMLVSIYRADIGALLKVYMSVQERLFLEAIKSRTPKKSLATPSGDLRRGPRRPVPHPDGSSIRSQ